MSHLTSLLWCYALLLSVSLATSSCSTWQKLDKTEKGAVIGTGSGALLGGAVGDTTGAVIGGAAGGVTGGVIGRQLERQDEREEQERREREYRERYGYD